MHAMIPGALEPFSFEVANTQNRSRIDAVRGRVSRSYFTHLKFSLKSLVLRHLLLKFRASSPHQLK
jgi:hypothetical protein